MAAEYQLRGLGLQRRGKKSLEQQVEAAGNKRGFPIGSKQRPGHSTLSEQLTWRNITQQTRPSIP